MDTFDILTLSAKAGYRAVPGNAGERVVVGFLGTGGDMRLSMVLLLMLSLPCACATGTETGPDIGGDATVGDGVSHAPEGPFTVITWNTGTAGGIRVPAEENFGYGPEQEKIADEYYGNGLAWNTAIVAAREFLATASPDLISFQEIFHSDDCADIPEAARAGFVCEDWAHGDPTVARTVLGPDYQIATHGFGRHDKVLAVHNRFGRIVGCDAEFCLDGLDGFPIEGCGRGGRVGRAVIERHSGERITVVSYHGRSGMLQRDFECRTQQVDQIFVDFGDGQPAANGQANIILGDFNTDPGRLQAVDESAARWNDFVGPGKPFQFISKVGEDAPGSYILFDIDHIVSDVFEGTVSYPGISPGTEPVYEGQLFDHIPVIATLTPVAR